MPHQYAVACARLPAFRPRLMERLSGMPACSLPMLTVEEAGTAARHRAPRPPLCRQRGLFTLPPVGARWACFQQAGAVCAYVRRVQCEVREAQGV